jgi:ankyrin repeat protein
MPRIEECEQAVELIKCVSYGEFERLDNLVFIEGYNINARNSKGFNLLHIAAIKGREKDIALARDLLIKYKANPNIADKITHSTPLNHAAMNGNKDMAKLLLDNKADPNIESAQKITPLNDAVYEEREEVVELLLNYGADPNTPDDDGQTPLHQAAFAGNSRIVNALLSVKDENGNDKVEVNKLNNSGYPPIYGANNPEIQNIIKAKESENAEKAGANWNNEANPASCEISSSKGEGILDIIDFLLGEES